MSKFKATIDSGGPCPVLRLSGILDGGIHFHDLLPTLPAELVVDLSGVRHANSSLIKPWMAYFGALAAQGSRLRFAGCTTSILEYINFVEGFLCGGAVESVEAPFLCRKCKRDFQALIETPDRQTALALVEGKKCPSCRTRADFDENPETFFRFLR